MLGKTMGFLAIGALTLALSMPAAAAPTNGVLTGCSVTWSAAGKISVQVGEAYASGNMTTCASPNYNPFTNLQTGQVQTANTAYYVYACYDTTALAFVPPVTSNIAPLNSGVPPGATPVKTSAATGGHTCDAIFLGSILTDSTNTLVPFTRSGETVILSIVDNSVCDGHPFGAGAEQLLNWVTGSALCQLVKFDSLSGVAPKLSESCNGHDSANNSLILPYPETASSMLIDWFIESADTNSNHWIEIPYETPNPAGPTSLSNYQVDLFFSDYSATSFTTTSVYQTRVVPVVSAGINTGNTPPAPSTQQDFYICIDADPTGAGASVGGYLMYRGYVESIGHLTQG